MAERQRFARQLGTAVFDDCWNRIGVHGDGSCAELKAHVHCRNCPVYSAGAAALLDGELPTDHLHEWTAHFARPKPTTEVDTRSVLIFRIADEWLALPTTVVVEVAPLRPIHTLPHRQNNAVLGVSNVRGELLVAVSLGEIVGVEGAAAPRERRDLSHRRMLVIRREDTRVICPVDEVHGTHRFHAAELKTVPATVSKAASTYSTGVLGWRERAVGVLDDQLLFYTLKRSLG